MISPKSIYDPGTQPLPINQRPGIILPTPENLDRVAADAAAKREAQTQASNCTPQSLGRSWGISVEAVQFIQRLEARVIELEREVALLRSTSTLPPHMRDIERRG